MVKKYLTSKCCQKFQMLKKINLKTLIIHVRNLKKDTIRKFKLKITDCGG